MLAAATHGMGVHQGSHRRCLGLSDVLLLQVRLVVPSQQTTQLVQQVQCFARAQFVWIDVAQTLKGRVGDSRDFIGLGVGRFVDLIPAKGRRK